MSWVWRPLDWLYEAGHSLWLGSTRAPRHELLFVDASLAGEVALDPARVTPATRIRASELPERAGGAVRLVCLADTHERHNLVDVPLGDVLVIAGDILALNRHFTVDHSRRKLRNFAHWLRQQPHRHKLVIGGNHDAILERLGAEEVRRIFHGCTYLCDDGVTVESLAVHGSPMSSGHSKNNAFQSNQRQRIASIPASCDVLITHGPPPKDAMRCPLPPRLSISGHIHTHHGVQVVGRTIRVCASIMDGRYRPTQPPIVVDLAASPE